MRAFFQYFPNWNAVRSELSWTHYRLFLRVDTPEARWWYMQEAAAQNWSTHVLERQIGTLYYDRLPQLVQPRSLFSTQPLRDRPSDRLRCDRPIHNTNPVQKASLERKRLERHEKNLPTFGYALPSAFAAHATHRKQLIQS
jgi:predicted nuclease of restriction endonuclease-like (RecB) superfamily